MAPAGTPGSFTPILTSPWTQRTGSALSCLRGRVHPPASLPPRCPLSLPGAPSCGPEPSDEPLVTCRPETPGHSVPATPFTRHRRGRHLPTRRGRVRAGGRGLCAASPCGQPRSRPSPWVTTWPTTPCRSRRGPSGAPGSGSAQGPGTWGLAPSPSRSGHSGVGPGAEGAGLSPLRPQPRAPRPPRPCSPGTCPQVWGRRRFRPGCVVHAGGLWGEARACPQGHTQGRGRCHRQTAPSRCRGNLVLNESRSAYPRVGVPHTRRGLSSDAPCPLSIQSCGDGPWSALVTGTMTIVDASGA